VEWFHRRTFSAHVPVLLSLLCGTAVTSSLPANDESEADLAQFYGFSAVELFKIDDRAFNLTAGDFDHDGRTDLLVVDNRASCLRLLRQRSTAAQAKQRITEHVNDLRSDWRFDVREIPVDKQVAGLTAGDFNSDGRIDVAYVGVPDRLVIRYQPPASQNDWSDSWSVRLPGLLRVAWMVSSGDINGDGRTDLVILGKSVTWILFQNDSGKMSSPESVINTSTQLSLVQAADINGDGRDDVCYIANEGSTRGLCARLQTADGRLGPELCFDLHQPRAVTLSSVDDDPGREIVTIDQRTGRVAVSRLQMNRAADDSLPRLVHFGIGDGSSSGQTRSIAVGDLDGDQLQDVIVTDPDNAQALVFRQNGIDGLGPAETFPSLLEATDLCSVDMNGDGRSELVLMSETENTVAFSRFENGRLTFPQPIMQAGEKKSFAGIQVLRGGDNAVLVICTRPKGRSGDRLTIHQRLISADGADALAADPIEVSAAGVTGNRGLRLMTIDANSDGREDLLLVPNGSGSEGVVTMLADESGILTRHPQAGRLSLGRNAAGALFVRGASVLVAREAFARSMSLQDGKWVVSDQFNAAEAKARIVGAAAMDLDEDGMDEIVLVDSGIKKLRVLRADSGLYRPWQEVELGDFKFRSATVTDLNGDNVDDLLLFCNQRLSILYSGSAGAELKEVASWESERENTYPADIIAGDINGDGAIDLTIIDTSINGLELLRVDPKDGIQSATHFRVFEEKRLVSNAQSRGTQPREGLVADVTGDDRPDLILLCHDKLIVYPQDPGKSE